MSQSEWIGAILIAGFILWLAMNQRLGVYWSILTGGAAAAAAPQSGTGPGGSNSSGSGGAGGGTNPPLKFTVPGNPPSTAPPAKAPSFNPLCILGGSAC